MDARIVYCPHEADRARLETLREQVRRILEQPICAADLPRAEQEFGKAERAYAGLMRCAALSQCRAYSAELLYALENAVCLLNKRYFHLGVKRVFEEFAAMRFVPEHFEALADRLARAKDTQEMRRAATGLLCAADECFARVRRSVQEPKPKAAAGDLRGTLEEMVSNYRGKLYEAAEHDNPHATLWALGSLQNFFDELSEAYDLPRCDALAGFDPADLKKTAHSFDDVIRRYRRRYDETGLSVTVYDTIDQFETAYNP
ncbi:MAG: hypothetical protein ACI4GO_07145 [Hominenteromicrobium sp.]